MKRKLLVLLLLYAASAFPQAEIDAAFGTSGKVVTAMGTNSNIANAVALQPDGKFLVGGTYVSNHGENDFALARFNANGSLDTTFGTAGKVVTSFIDNGHNYSFVNSIHPLPDGRFIVVGTSGVASLFSKLVMARYNADGSLDTGFGTNGKVISTLWPNSLPGNKLVFLPGGGFMVTSAKLYVDTQNYDVAVEKYTEDGILDTSFGTNGQVVTSYSGGLNSARSTPAAIALKADGKFVVAGAYLQGAIYRMALAQFNANGTLDTTFDGDGKVITNFGAGIYSDGLGVFVAEDGKITMAGNVSDNVSRNFGLVRYNTNGTLDTSFDTDGMLISPFAADDAYSFINAVILQEGGKYIVVCRPGYGALETSDFVVRRYNADGSADAAFGTNGRASASFDTGQSEAQLAVVTAEGEIIAAGKSSPFEANHIDFAVAKFTQAGVLDTAFADGGKVIVAFEKGNDELTQLLLLPNDKILAVGTSGYRQSNNTVFKDIVLAKYNADGSLDASFGNAGRVYSAIGQNRYTVITAALQADGKIVVSTMYGNNAQIYYLYEILRYNADGTLDTSFGTEGRVSVNYNVTSLIFQPDGKIIATGDGYIDGVYKFIVNRFNVNGTLDASFGTNGNAFVPFGGPTFGLTTAVLQADGKIVVCGTASNPDLYAGAMALAGVRFNANGSVDNTYGDNGMITAIMGDVYLFSKSFIRPDGKMVITGRSVSGSFGFTTMRFTENGVLDTTYGTGGFSSVYLGDYREVKSVIMQPDAKFLVALSKYNQPAGSYDFMLKRFNADGSLDADFSGAEGITTSFYNGYDEAFSVTLQSDNKIVLAGSTHNGISKDFALVRYGNDLVGITEPNAVQAGITLYPNPAKDRLHIKAGQGVEVVNYNVYNMLGQMVFGGGTTQEVETANLAGGVYTLQVATNKGLISRKFIKE